MNRSSIREMSINLLRHCSNTAFERMKKEAQDKHQSVQTIARRRVSNMLRNYALRIAQ